MNISFGSIKGVFYMPNGDGGRFNEDKVDVYEKNNKPIISFNLGLKNEKTYPINTKKGIVINKMNNFSILSAQTREKLNIKASNIEDGTINLGKNAKFFAKKIKNAWVNSLNFNKKIYEGKKVTIETDEHFVSTSGQIKYDRDNS